jgi:hypothetical protein
MPAVKHRTSALSSAPSTPSDMPDAAPTTRWPDDLTPRSPNPATASRARETDTHLIRLCLDLQLDALLLTLGAAVTADHAFAPQWRRWVVEDVQTAYTLATDVRAGGASLPATLGLEHDRCGPATAMGNLVPRYESMIGLLTDVLRRAAACPAPGSPRVRAVLDQCRRRLDELRTALDGRPAVLHLDEDDPCPLPVGRAAR